MDNLCMLFAHTKLKLLLAQAHPMMPKHLPSMVHGILNKYRGVCNRSSSWTFLALLSPSVLETSAFQP